MQEFYSKTPISIVGGLIYIIIVSSLMFLIDKLGSNLITFVTILSNLCFVLYNFHGLNCKITVTDSEIIMKTFLVTRKLNFKNIKTIGIYYWWNDNLEIVNYQNQSKFSESSQRIIYLSTRPNHEPRYFTITNKNFIDFHYNDEIYSIIKNKIKASR